MFFLLLHCRRFRRGFQEFGESVELALPELMVFVYPRLRVAHGRGAKMYPVDSAVLLAADEPGTLEDFEVLGDGWPRHIEGRGQIANGGGPFGEALQYGAAGGIGQGGEGRIESGGHIINRLVKYN